MKKSSLLAFVFSVLASVAVAYAGNSDIMSFTNSKGEVFRINREGTVFTSSGIAGPTRGLLQYHEDFDDLPLSSNTWFLNPQIRITTRTVCGATAPSGLCGFSTSYADGMGGVPITNQPGVPRTIEILMSFASGYVILSGTDSFRRSVTETIYATSGTIAYGKVPFIYLSSFTVAITSVSQVVGFSTPTFTLGTSTGIGLAMPIDRSTDVYKVSENWILRSTYTANPDFDTINIGNQAQGTSDWHIWYFIRRTLFAPFNP